jgi:hypothetical protein
MALDTLLIISCICIVIAITLYFFHWNRFLAFLIGWGIRLLYWNNESSSIWVEIGVFILDLTTRYATESAWTKALFIFQFSLDGYFSRM